MMAIDKQTAYEGRIKIGSILRHIREKEGKTLEDVAEPIGLSRQTVSKIELGKWNAGTDHLYQIAESLGYEWTLVKKQTQ